MTTSKQPSTGLDVEARDRTARELDVLREQRRSLDIGDDPRTGDRVDDAEALRRLDDAALLDDRIAELTRLLAGAPPTSGIEGDALLPDGSVITIRHGDGTVEALRAVARTEQVPPGQEDGSLTLDSPLGRALAGHKVGETVGYATPHGRRRAEILQIQPPT
jgi:transcription elongation GreA/GreB family factor